MPDSNISQYDSNHAQATNSTFTALHPFIASHPARAGRWLTALALIVLLTGFSSGCAVWNPRGTGFQSTDAIWGKGLRPKDKTTTTFGFDQRARQIEQSLGVQ